MADNTISTVSSAAVPATQGKKPQEGGSRLTRAVLNGLGEGLATGAAGGGAGLLVAGPLGGLVGGGVAGLGGAVHGAIRGWNNP